MNDVAVIGLGYFSHFHLAAWQAQPGFRLVGGVDPKSVARVGAEQAFDIRTFADPEALLAEVAPGVVDIVAPPLAHAALIRAVLEPGRIVICQKPFCRGLTEACQVMAEAEATGTILVIHENFRFQPWHRTIKALLDEGRLGQVWQARFDLRPGDGRGADAYLARQPAFRTMPRLLLHETGVHFVDLFRWFFGDITGVYARLDRLNPVLQGEDAGLMVLDHVSGVRSVFDGNRLADHVSDNPRRTMGDMEIVGEGGTLTLNGAGEVGFRPFGSSETETVTVTKPIDDSVFGGGCVQYLIEHVAARLDCPETIENQVRDYLPVIAATEAAYRSAEDGCRVAPVTLPETPA